MKIHYLAQAKTDIGTVKQVNQDSLTVKVVDTPLGEAALAVICDGMGGLAKGELASAIVVRAFENWFLEELPYKLRKLCAEAVCTDWERLVSECNRKIRSYGTEQMGTTLTAMLLFDGAYYLIHVGDCRAYEMAGGMKQMTQDQTFVAREVALGHMTKEQAKTDSRRNVLLQCIGVKEQVEPVFQSGKIIPGACYLLCSDGFRHKVAGEEILETYREGVWEPLRRQCSEKEILLGMGKVLVSLITRSMERGEEDNLSAVCVQTLELEETQTC